MERSCPKFRDDLIQSRQEFEKTTYYVIKDPITQRFFRIKEFEYFITQKLDGKTSLDEIAQKFQERFHIPLPLETLEKFVQRIESLGFLEGDITERELAQLQYQKRTFLGKILFIKLKGFDPDKLLDRLVKHTRFLFSPTFLIVSLFIILLAMVITLSSWGDLGYSFKGIFKIATILKVWIAIFLVVVLHEFAHGLTCKYFGGEVHEMGFLLLYFQPCFFCNVSDAYLFGEKSQKLMVTFAGAYCQIFVWAAATILWRITALDTGLNGFLFVVVITSGITVLFNFNPLIKLDGYYLLADYLEIPNLRKKTFGYISALLRKRYLREKEPQWEATLRAKRIYVSYGILSLLYSALLLFWVLVKTERFLVTQLGGIGFILFLVLIFIILRTPGKVVLSGMAQFLSLKKEEWMKNRKRIWIYPAVIMALVLILFLVKMELKIGSSCEIKALEYFTLRNLPDGTVTSELFQGGTEEKKTVNLLKLYTTDFATLNLTTSVKEGQKVDIGEIVAELTSLSYLSNITQVKENLRKAEDYYKLLQKGARKETIQQAKDKVEQTKSELKLKEKELNRLSNLHEKKLISIQELEKAQTEYEVMSNQLSIAQNELNIIKDGSRPEELSMAESEMIKWKSQLKFLEGQVSDSRIKSPIHGVVTSISSEGNLLSISNLDTVRVIIEVSEKDLDVIKEGQRVKLKIQSYPFLSFWGIVTKISQMADIEGPKKIFPVTCKIENSALCRSVSGGKDYLLKPGMTGYAKVYCGKHSLFNLLTRRIVRYLRVEVWSWW